ncbi:hypothetical protein [Streptomyces sp. NPDC087294]|uniref:hypothetical protein n=1 Tax=Streptomyces sp. NPDC087294 TaxID=3365777 RepID=UPI003802E632
MDNNEDHIPASQTPMTAMDTRTRLEQYGARTSTWSTATYNDGTEKTVHEIALALLAEAERLEAERNAFRDQRNEVFSTNRQLHAQVEESGRARLRAENDTRTARREADTLRARVAELEAALTAPWDEAETEAQHAPPAADEGQPLEANPRPTRKNA